MRVLAPSPAPSLLPAASTIPHTNRPNFSAIPCSAQESEQSSSPKPKTIRFRLSSLCQNGQLELARQLFDSIPHPTTVLWNSLIIGYVCNGLPHEGISLYSRMLYSAKSSPGLKCDAYTYSSVLKACAETRQLLIGKSLHCHVLRSNVYPSRIVWNSLLNMYSACLLSSEYDFVERVFAGMRKRNVVSWNIMISWYANTGRFVEAVEHLVMMLRTGLRPSVVSFLNVIPAVSGLRSIAIASAICGMVAKYGEDFFKDMFFVSSCITMYAELGCLDFARKLFDSLLERNAHVWNAMIGGYALNNCPSLALELFLDALETQCDRHIDEVTFVLVLTAASNLQHFDVAQQLHAYLIKSSMASVVLLNAIMSLYSKCNSIDDAYRVFRQMQERDVVSWNTMICALVQKEMEHEAFILIHEMQKQGIYAADDVTITALLSIASNLRNAKIGKQAHAYLIRNGFQISGMASYLIDMYAKSGFMKIAEGIFERTCRSSRDLATWNSMMSSYTQNGLIQEALALLQQMLHDNKIVPNAVTLASLLPACSKLGGVELGKKLHCFAIRNSLEMNVFLSSALVDMYSKSGSILYAERVFGKSTERNSVTYTNMIQGYGQHGLGENALKLFHSMKETGIQPDAITFVAILSACSYSGLINDGLALFQSMQTEHDITPSTEHYACVVDMLARVGRLSEAYSFAEKLGTEGNVLGIWGSLLAACRVHKDFELGKLVARKMLEMEGESDRITTGYHVLLSNMHAEGGNWEDVKSAREQMMERGLAKEVGCSWIEICGDVFCFSSRDRKHPRCGEIYEEVKRLSANLRDDANFTPAFLASE